MLTVVFCVSETLSAAETVVEKEITYVSKDDPPILTLHGAKDALVTHVEWKSRYVLAARINGKELAKFQEIEKTLGLKVYFTDAYSPWQRRTNKNTNAFLREFFPRGTDFTQVSHQTVDAAVRT